MTTEAIAFTQDKDGKFGITFKDGKIVKEPNEVSFAKHNLLCFGRLNKNLTKNQQLRQGCVGSILEGRNLYSTAWSHYMEGNITLDTMKRLIQDYNAACDRDYKAGLIDKKIKLKSVTKLDKNSLQFKIQIGEQDQNFTINLK